MKLLLYFAFIVTIRAQEGCVITIADLVYQPVVVYESNYEFVYPPPDSDEEVRDIPLSPNTTIIMICPGGNITTSAGVQSSMIYVTCGEDSQMIYNDEAVDFNSISCSDFRLDTVRDTQVPCADDGRIYVVGFEVELSFSFLPLLTVCFDTVRRNPLWTNYQLSSSISVYEHAINTKIFDPDIYNLDLDFGQLYNIDYQRSQLNSLVGLPENSTQYIDAKALWNEDLVQGYSLMTRYQMIAAFRYFQSVPQWLILNGYYNWDRMETSIWQYAYRNQVNLDIYTGTYGISTLPHVDTGEDIEIYLYTDAENQAVPIPDLFWKVVFDPLTRRATAFVTINGPYIRNVTSKVLCDDISEGMDWLIWFNINDPLYGYSYACTYQDLKNAISYIPELDVVDILA